MNSYDSQLLKYSPMRWDAHVCPPYKIGADLSFLYRYKKAGLSLVSLNVGFDLMTQSEILSLIKYFKDWINNHFDDYMQVESVEQLIDCQSKKKLGIIFDVEGCNVLNSKIEMVSYLYNAGVRQMLFAYNNNNTTGGGCLDVDIGLTKFGKQLVEEFNNVGMIIDCSHVSFKTSMDIIALSDHPVVFSHSNPRNLCKHPRNITDEQIIACAKKDGVIGINGVGIFLGNNDTRTEKIVAHIDYIAQMVGSRHVGIGLDCLFDKEISSLINKYPNTFPTSFGFNNVEIAKPEQFYKIKFLLEKKGYSIRDIDNILGENFFRISKTVWK